MRHLETNETVKIILEKHSNASVHFAIILIFFRAFLALSSDRTSSGSLFHISVAFVCVVFPAHDRWSGATTFPDDWPRVTGPSWVCFWNCFRLFQASIIIAFSDIFSTDAMPIVDRISDIGHSPYLGSPTTARTPAFDARCIFNFCSAFKFGLYAASLYLICPHTRPRTKYVGLFGWSVVPLS